MPIVGAQDASFRNSSLHVLTALHRHLCEIIHVESAVMSQCTADECLASGANLPRFCSLDGKDSLICAAKPVTCPLIQVVGDLLGEATAAHRVCGDPHVLGTGSSLLNIGLLSQGSPPLLPIPDPVSLRHRLDEILSQRNGITQRYEDLRQRVESLRQRLGFSAIPINPLPTIDTLNNQIEIELKRAEQAIRDIRDFVRIPGLGGLIAAYHRAEMIAAANAQLNEQGFPRHHAAVELFLLQKLGIPSPIVKKGSEILLKKQIEEKLPENPFF
jgi:hypothetical protein